MITSDAQGRIDALRPWFHTIPLDNGGCIERDAVYGSDRTYPAALWDLVRAILPVDVAGARVLDVGCNGGRLSIEMKRAGASEVVGLEAFPQYLQQARLARELTGLEIDYRQMDVYEVDERLGSFDITLFLGVIYHLKNPIGALENLARVTRGVIVVESAILPEMREQLPEMSHFGGRGHVAAFIENGGGIEALENWFVPTADALRAWLAAAGFRRVLAEHVTADRSLIVAAKP
jgi:tRNA (mo5U34)-methyltransferase